MIQYGVYGHCFTFQCESREEQAFFVSSSRDEAKEKKEALEEFSSNCPHCGKNRYFRVEKELVYTEDLLQKISETTISLEEMKKNAPFSFQVVEPKENAMGRIREHQIWTFVPEEDVEDFEYYNPIFHAMGTIFYDGEKFAAYIGTNFYKKPVARRLVELFQYVLPMDSYDQLTAPEWSFSFSFTKQEEVVTFFKIAFHLMLHPQLLHKEKEKFIFAVIEKEGENFFYLMNKADWKTWKTYFPNEYENPPVWLQLKRAFPYQQCEDGSFTSPLGKEALIEKLGLLENFEHCLDFQSFIEYEENART